MALGTPGGRVIAANGARLIGADGRQQIYVPGANTCCIAIGDPCGYCAGDTPKYLALTLSLNSYSGVCIPGEIWSHRWTYDISHVNRSFLLEQLDTVPCTYAAAIACPGSIYDEWFWGAGCSGTPSTSYTTYYTHVECTVYFNSIGYIQASVRLRDDNHELPVYRGNVVNDEIVAGDPIDCMSSYEIPVAYVENPPYPHDGVATLEPA